MLIHQNNTFEKQTLIFKASFHSDVLISFSRPLQKHSFFSRNIKGAAIQINRQQNGSAVLLQLNVYINKGLNAILFIQLCIYVLKAKVH